MDCCRVYLLDSDKVVHTRVEAKGQNIERPQFISKFLNEAHGMLYEQTLRCSRTGVGASTIFDHSTDW